MPSGRAGSVMLLWVTDIFHVIVHRLLDWWFITKTLICERNLVIRKSGRDFNGFHLEAQFDIQCSFYIPKNPKIRILVICSIYQLAD